MQRNPAESNNEHTPQSDAPPTAQPTKDIRRQRAPPQRHRQHRRRTRRPTLCSTRRRAYPYAGRRASPTLPAPAIYLTLRRRDGSSHPSP